MGWTVAQCFDLDAGLIKVKVKWGMMYANLIRFNSCQLNASIGDELHCNRPKSVWNFLACIFCDNVNVRTVEHVWAH